MKKTFTLLLLMVVCVGLTYAQPRVKIVMESVTPYTVKYAPFNTDSSVTTAGRIVAKGTYVYVRAWNFGDATPITSATWTMLSKPTGSNATFSAITGLPTWAKFKADSTGTYQIKVTMVAGATSKDTIETIVASKYVGTGGFDGVTGTAPNCNTCHSAISPDIFNRWKVSKHAINFKFYVDSGSAGFGTSCFKCHTVGYDKNQVVDNNGFDDNARRLGWVWSNYSPPKPGNWDSIKTRFPGLVQYTGVGCESCHGPGSEHIAAGGDTSKVMKNYGAGLCASCHDSPDHHSNTKQFSQSLHSTALWSSSFAQTNNGTNDLNNCIRCHDAKGYINFTKGIGTNTNGITQGWHDVITCQTCHDPHGNSNFASLRNRPTNSDTLATGFHYAGGNAKVCMDCHKARRNNVTYTQTRVTSSTWGPHHSTQSDVLLGKNAATFNNLPYITGSHANAITDACVTCHMAPTPDTSHHQEHNKIGGHSMKMSFDSTGFDNTAGCDGCHAGITSFDQFDSPSDFDGNGLVESWQKEIDGCIHNLGAALPHYAGSTDSVSWQLIAADSFNVNLRKAYWNYQLIKNDGSRGLHNPFFAVNVLLASISSVIGIEYQWTETPKTFSLTQNYPNPFNPTTKFTFSVPKTQLVTIRIYDILGREVKTLVNTNINIGKYTVSWDGTNDASHQVSTGVYFYRMETSGFVDVKKMVLVK